MTDRKDLMLYKIDPIGFGQFWGPEVNDLLEALVLVPVEPCVHGKYDAHLYVERDDPQCEHLCPGAGLGGTL